MMMILVMMVVSLRDEPKKNHTGVSGFQPKTESMSTFTH